MNQYRYVLNSPQNYVDPSGYFWDEIGSFFGGVSDFFSSFSGGTYQSQVATAQTNNQFLSNTLYGGECGWCGGANTYQLDLYKCAGAACPDGPRNIGAEAAMIVANLNGEGDVPRSLGGPSQFARAAGVKPIDEFIREARSGAPVNSAAGAMREMGCKQRT